MIDSMFPETCQILSRQEGTRDSWGNYQYNPSDTVPCLFKNVTGRLIETARIINKPISGFMFLVNEVKEGDKIIYDDYEYEIVGGGISKLKDFISGKVECYRIAVEKRKAYPDEKIPVKEV